jgi:hypothetical protein
MVAGYSVGLISDPTEEGASRLTQHSCLRRLVNVFRADTAELYLQNECFLSLSVSDFCFAASKFRILVTLAVARCMEKLFTNGCTKGCHFGICYFKVVILLVSGPLLWDLWRIFFFRICVCVVSYLHYVILQLTS